MLYSSRTASDSAAWLNTSLRAVKQLSQKIEGTDHASVTFGSLMPDMSLRPEVGRKRGLKKTLEDPAS
jgi:hypothetical protein